MTRRSNAPQPRESPLWPAIGWDLLHPQFVRRPLSRSHLQTVPPSGLVADCISEHASDANTAAAVFLGTRAWETVWARAVGSGVRLFRSAAVEDEAWQELAWVAGRLGRTLRSGGWLVCRLQQPRCVCRVQRRPTAPFALADRIDSVHCLRLLDQSLAPLVFAKPREAGWPVTLRCRREHPFYAYLKAFAAEVSPAVTIAELPSGTEVLAETAAGEAIAAVCGRLVLLPTLRRGHPRREAELLFDAVAPQLVSGDPPEGRDRPTSGGRTPLPPAVGDRTRAHVDVPDGGCRRLGAAARKFPTETEQRFPAEAREATDCAWLATQAAGLEQLMQLVRRRNLSGESTDAPPAARRQTR